MVNDSKNKLRISVYKSSLHFDVRLYVRGREKDMSAPSASLVTTTSIYWHQVKKDVIWIWGGYYWDGYDGSEKVYVLYGLST